MFRMEQISGTFEIHMIVDPEDEVLLYVAVKNLQDTADSTIISPRVTCAQALYGNFPRQPMLTFFMSGEYKNVSDTVMRIQKNLEDNNLRILRTKIEATLSNKGVPEKIQGPHHYVEFHFKVSVKNSREWNEVADICSKRGAHLFFNPCSRTSFVDPVVTLRRYNISVEEARKECSILKGEIQEKFSLIGETTSEFSCYDSDVFYDQGWLFKKTPTEFMYSVPIRMSEITVF